MWKWLLLGLAAIAGGAGAAGKAPKEDAAWVHSPSLDTPFPMIFFKDKPCRLPIAAARDMREMAQPAMPEFIQYVGCWAPALQDGYVVTIKKFTKNGTVSQDTMPTYYFEEAAISKDGTITRRP